MLLIGFLFLLGGCQQQAEQSAVQLNESKPAPQTQHNLHPIHTLHKKANTFRFVAGWLTNSTIIFVEHADGQDQIMAFDLRSGETELLYTEDGIVANVLVHPDTNELLIQSSESSNEAIVKYVAADGTVKAETTVQSSELEIAWNDADPAQLLLTAFQEDWSFETFHYNLNEQSMERLEIDDPFPKWIDKDRFVYTIEEGEGQAARSLVQKALEGEQEPVADEVVSVYADNGLVVAEQASNGEGEEARLLVVTPDQVIETDWTPEQEDEMLTSAHRIDDDKIIMSTNSLNAAGDEAMNVYIIEDEKEEVLQLPIEGSSVTCSPSGDACLVGYLFDQLLLLEDGSVEQWLILEDSE